MRSARYLLNKMHLDPRLETRHSSLRTGWTRKRRRRLGGIGLLLTHSVFSLNQKTSLFNDYSVINDILLDRADWYDLDEDVVYRRRGSQILTLESS